MIAPSTLIGVAINYLGINPIRALFLTAVINGLTAPPLLVLIMVIANDHRIVGERTKNRFTNALGWLTAAAMSVAAVILVGSALTS